MLTADEKEFLLKLARYSIEAAVESKKLPAVNLKDFSGLLAENGASFVTLTIRGELRGCIGALEPYQPFVMDVQEHAVAAALEDPRFDPVVKEELPLIHIEISRLTLPERLDYSSPEDLVAKLRPGVDGVILKDMSRRATFLPQVWDALPQPEVFLGHLCNKMGAPTDHWKRKKLEVLVYQVEEFQE